MSGIIFGYISKIICNSSTYSCKFAPITFRRTVSNYAHKQLPAKVAAWQIYEYGGVDKLTHSDSVKLPVIRRPDDVLVEVHAASVNPIDTMMLGGYGYRTINAYRCLNSTLRYGSEFPLILGRDFSGRIVGLGEKVDRNRYQIGDEVWGAGNVAFPGTFAQYITISCKEMSLKPKKLSHLEAASIPYVSATTWTAIRTVGRFNERNTHGKRVLVVGASGGIGTFAVQLLKAWGANVTAVCSSDASEKVLQLGADVTIDYTRHDVWQELESSDKFDLVLDAVGGDTLTQSLKVLTLGGVAVSIITPILRNTNEYGFVQGTARTVIQMTQLSCKPLVGGKSLRWSLFMPSGDAMNAVSQLVDSGKIVPIVEKVFPFNELPHAIEKVLAGHNRGKTVLDVIGNTVQ